MRVLTTLLLLGCVVGIASAITGIQAFEADSRVCIPNRRVEPTS
jgi:hypothetical protein